MKVSWIKLKFWTRWILFVVVAGEIISGLGIKYFRTTEAVTFGLLTKNLAFRIHDYLVIPLIVLLILHIYSVRKAR